VLLGGKQLTDEGARKPLEPVQERPANTNDNESVMNGRTAVGVAEAHLVAASTRKAARPLVRQVVHLFRMNSPPPRRSAG
jgi:hypothetical protein